MSTGLVSEAQHNMIRNDREHHYALKKLNGWLLLKKQTTRFARETALPEEDLLVSLTRISSDYCGRTSTF